MYGTIIIFRLKPPHDPNVASELVKKLYGQDTSNHKGKYHYHRKGLLEEIPAHRLIRGVIIVRKDDEERILEFLERFNTEVFVRRLELTYEDVTALGLK
jgi:hypothetical protein